MQLWDDKLFQPIISVHFGKSCRKKQNQVSLLKFILLASAIFTQAILQKSPDLVTRDIKKKEVNHPIIILYLGNFFLQLKNKVKILRFDLVLFMIWQTGKGTE